MPGPYDKKPMGAFSMPEPQVPPGNPIAEHYQQSADDMGTAAGGMTAGAGVVGGLSLVELLEGNPAALIGLLGGGGGLMAGAGMMHGKAQDAQGTADMWHNRFGSGDPNQGLPGTPSGPAWRK
jgi:hypothetical protein